ncbi:MAG: UDP-N-acetylmuramate dehydrogenase [Propionicimonas sp.]|uniref:UDP-N-acetylmuramate dehydrogenase n=1 Tax=Propionicimonas sp. TaxID=1955623 RepID=UPI002B1FFDD0|nr:UDP-N-acetylmuramate dehydrogenase [Propionicimonas sp.]MEA4942814.1 UDP-N-acetylmuramate dehydrogenase [Propionicimonas sp.]
MTDLAELTTLRVGGPAKRVVTPACEEELIALVRDCDAAGEPVLVIGGGSNLLVADAGFAGTVIRTDGLRGIEHEDVTACAGAFLQVAAGEPWDDFVASCVGQAEQRQGFVGVEALSGIPGLVGSTPIQNVGAYGQEVSQTIARVRVWDRQLGQVTTLFSVDCRFGYRTSVFKRNPGRYVVLSVSFQLALGKHSTPLRYGELARRLGVADGETAPLADVRDAVLELRRGKGMVLDPADHDTWSAGSFFTNPILTSEQAAALPPEAPRFPAAQQLFGKGGARQVPDQRVKTSAAWLIQHAGFARGYGTPPATLSTKHVLALTNRGGATAADLLALAREVRDGVQRTFGIRLEPEPVLVGLALD